LKQPQKDNTIKPVFFFSKKLTEPQKKKRAIFLECFAIKESILYWQYHLMDKKFTIFSDHKPLENFNIKNCQDPELLTILEYISNFNFDIKYNPGKNNAEADSLSRNPVLEEDDENESIIKIVNYVTLDDIKDNQKKLNTENENFKEKDNVYYKIMNNKEKI